MWRLALIAAAAGVLVWLAAAVDVLVVRHRDAVLIEWGIAAGDVFVVGYTHSVNKSPVADAFEWTGEEIMLRQSRFQSLGAGMPHPADFPGSYMYREGDWFILSGIDVGMRRIAILVHAYSEQYISLGGERALLAELAGDGASIEVEVVAIPRIKRFRF